MGALTADIVDSWLLVENDVNLRTEKRVENDFEARVSRGWLEQSDSSVVHIKRQFVGLLAWTDSTGDETSGFTYYVGRRSLSFSRTGGLEYLCTRDRLMIEDYVNGAGWQEQIWERQTEWEPVEGSYFENPVPDEPEPEPEP